MSKAQKNVPRLVRAVEHAVFGQMRKEKARKWRAPAQICERLNQQPWADAAPCRVSLDTECVQMEMWSCPGYFAHPHDHAAAR